MPDHREIVDENRFPEWGRLGSFILVCPRCSMSIRFNMEIIFNSMTTTDLRPCPYCWGLNRLPLP